MAANKQRSRRSSNVLDNLVRRPSLNPLEFAQATASLRQSTADFGEDDVERVQADGEEKSGTTSTRQSATRRTSKGFLSHTDASLSSNSHLPVLGFNAGSISAIHSVENEYPSSEKLGPSSRTSIVSGKTSTRRSTTHRPSIARRVSRKIPNLAETDEGGAGSQNSLDFILSATKTGTVKPANHHRTMNGSRSKRISVLGSSSSFNNTAADSVPQSNTKVAISDEEQDYVPKRGSIYMTECENIVHHGPRRASVTQHGTITASRRVSLSMHTTRSSENPPNQIEEAHHPPTESGMTKPPTATSGVRYTRPISRHSNLTDFEEIEEMERRREEEAKQWRAKKLNNIKESGTTPRNDETHTTNTTTKKSNNNNKKTNRHAKNGFSETSQAFMDFSNVEQLQLVNMTQDEENGKRTIPAWKSKWENALLVNEAAMRFIAKKKQINYDMDDSKSAYGYRHNVVDPNKVFNEGETEVKSWRYNGELIQESIVRASTTRRESRPTMTTRLISGRPPTAGGVGSDPAEEAVLSYWDTTLRKRSSTVPANINLMSNILTEDTNRRIERDLIGMGQKRLGKCPFISDPDLSSQNLPSLWGVLQKFRFPTEQDKKLLETVHKLHPTSVAKYKDLRKVLQWAPLKYSIFKSNIAETKRKDETTWIPISMDDNTNETTFPPPKISAIGLAKQRQDMTQDVTRNRLLGPIIAQRNNTTQQQQHPIPIALHPKLTNRIIQVSIDKETKAQNAQQLVFSNDCKHRTGILILATAKSEFEMLESLKVKHKQMAKSRSLVKSNVEGVNTGSVEKELAHWFMKKKHLDFHAERFGFSHKRITGAVGGAVPIDIDSLS